MAITPLDRLTAAHGLVIYQGKILLLLRDNNPQINDPNWWSLLGGLAEEGETLEETFIRELNEETSIKIEKPQFLMEKPLANGNFYYVILNDYQAQNIKLGSEGQRLEFFTLEEIEKLPLSGENSRILFRDYKSKIEEIIFSSAHELQ